MMSFTAIILIFVILTEMFFAFMAIWGIIRKKIPTIAVFSVLFFAFPVLIFYLYLFFITSM